VHALVTGASSGIGQSIARRLARDGHSLTLVARREAELQALAAELKVPTCVVAADLSVDACDSVVAAAVAAHGPVEILVNNAGVQTVDLVHRIGAADARRMMSLNLDVPLRLFELVLPEMVSRGRGRIVNISSMAGVTPTPAMAHYSASKAALGAFSEAAGRDLADTGVHVLTVYPGPVATPMEAAARARLPGLLARLVPTGDADELADRIVYALEWRKPRLFYPSFYALGWWLGGLGALSVLAGAPKPVVDAPRA
jgi:short-subunit dehydrogenase